MIHSMTGFGEASREAAGVHYAVELRSLNNRYFKFTSRLPEELQPLEAEIETRLKRRFARGSFSASVKIRRSGAAAASAINDDALLNYLNHLESIKQRLGNENVTIDLTQLLALPGVMEAPTTSEAFIEAARPTVDALVGEAADGLDAMRAAEGEQLAAELRLQHARLVEVVDGIGERAPLVVNEYHAKLGQRVAELTRAAELNVERHELLREVAVFADRADISEELARLRCHLEQFEAVIASDPTEPAGRMLDFLAQELLRECNTIGSKSNDTAISRGVVEAKSLVDRLKEQVQNVE